MSSRKEALEKLDTFIDRVFEYASERSYVTQDNKNVSKLSPWIRYRVISEEEVVRAVLHRLSFKEAEKFIQELMWRTYWKGWLELRPTIWSRFLEECNHLRLLYQGSLLYQSALVGQSELSFFNEWVQELLTQGYLHNHIRMWFASVWIFSLKLPWQLGAEFMFRHLLDGDPASNTLSWRWVAGVQTVGKHYVARSENISKYSQGRWNPRKGELAENPAPILGDSSESLTSLPTFESKSASINSCALIHDDDLSADLVGESSPSGSFILCTYNQDRSPLVRSFVSQLREDTRKRVSGVLVTNSLDLAGQMQNLGAREVTCYLPRVGPELNEILKIKAELSEMNLVLNFRRREWDSYYYPHASKGFFPFWKKVSAELAA